MLLLGCTRGAPARPTDGDRASQDAPLRDFTSGTRLIARSFAFDDVSILRDFFDTSLELSCDFDLPGNPRLCLPVSRAIHREGVGPYADVDCTEAWAVADAPAQYAVVTPIDACAGAPIVHRAGPSEERRAWFRSDGRCVRGLVPASIQPLREIVPSDSFASAHEENEAREGRIDARVLVVDDGTRVLVGGFDRERGEIVAPDDAADGALRWLPSRVAFRNAGAELPPSCEGAATKIASTALCPISATLVLEGICGRGAFYELGAPVTSACVPGSFAFSVGAPIAADAFARASYADRGRGPVRRRDFDGVMLGELVDTESGEPCVVLPAADGVLRCLPAQVELVGYFSDEECTVPAFAHALSGCEAGAFATRVRDGAKAYEVIGTAEALHERRGDACAPFEPVVRSTSFSVRELPPGRLPPATER